MFPHERPWDKNLQLFLVGIIAFNTFPLFTEIPPWASVLTVSFLGWKGLYLWRGVKRPPRWILWFIVVAATAGIFASYGTIIGQEAASALLVVLTSAKLLETNRYRDAMIVIFTSYFLLMAHLLNSQSLLSTVYMATDVMLITSLMFQAHKSDRRTSIRSLRPVMKMLAFAIPVWVFLFVAFPRFSTGAWNMTQTKKIGSGFSDNLNPGEVEKLVEIDEPAFRVTFKGEVLPPMEALYWRGAILTESDGLQWKRPRNERDLATDPNARSKERLVYEYRISLEPAFRTWLFLLDYPTAVTLDSRSLKTRERFGFIHETNRESLSRLFYDGVSSTFAPQEPLSQTARDAMMQLPADLDPRIVQLAKDLRERAEKASGPPNLADRLSDEILAWFTKEGFRYTREPGSFTEPTGAAQLATFLFERKRGFCEHYAAAFATIARAAGIPARITVGFHGGKVNEIGEYVLVRSLDAHAWAEVWREDTSGRGRWTRIDPTSVIAPLRLQIGGDFNLLEPSMQSATVSEYERQVANSFSRITIRFELAWDAVQMKWTAFLNDYDFEFQKDVLDSLGLAGLSRLALAAIALLGVAVIMGALAFVMRRKTVKRDALLAEWRAFCRKLERSGLEARGASEGPLDFAERAVKTYPKNSTEIRKVAQLYCELRYGAEPVAEKQASKILRQSARDVSIDATIDANSRSATS